MSASENRSSSRGDDDWGKLASDLLGINLGAEDLDLSDLETPPPAPVPVKVPPVTATHRPPPVAAPAPVIDLSDMDFEAAEEEEPVSDEDAAEDDRDEVVTEEYDSDLEDDDEVEDEAELDSPASETAAAEPAEPDKFWDALESWDWEAAGEDSPAGAGADRTRRPEGRGNRGDRDRGRSEGRSGSRGERPRSREDRQPRREERPARPDSGPPAERREQAAERPAARPPRPAAPERRSPPPRDVRTPAGGDEFGTGIDEGPLTGDDDRWGQKPPARSLRGDPVPLQDEGYDDEFVSGVNLDDEESESGMREASSSTESSDEPSRPRRRRRRRRRGSGDREPNAARSVSEDADEFSSPPEDDRADEDVAPRSELDEGEPEGEPGDQPERRGRRRRRRRSGERPQRAEAPSHREDEDLVETSDAGDEESPVEEEAVVAVSYEDIPTWEEAIACLLKPRSDGRGDGGGYRGPPRRRS